MISHKKYMEMAIKLAEKGAGSVSPNPLVGCVLVKRGKVIAKAFHKKFGEDHAEVRALKQAGKKAQNATLYVNLEPCSHWGKTPPCTERIVESGVREVIIGMEDPNPLVDGYKELKFRGLKTKIGILEKEAKALNESYITYMKHKRPFAVVKLAMSLDGKIATSTGDSKYITGMPARRRVHEIRHDFDAVMIGINTVIKDDPLLDARLVKGANPIKVIVDSTLKIPEKSKVLKDPSKVIIATTKKAQKKKSDALHKKGVTLLTIKEKDGQVDVKALMKELANNNISQVMIEGGSELAGTCIREKQVDKLMIFMAPKIIGNGLGPLQNLGVRKVNKAIKLKNITTEMVGKDLLAEGYL